MAAPLDRVRATSRVVALLGHPVAHSVSPEIHNAAFAAAGVDAVYVALDVLPDGVRTAVAAVRALGLLGANVTVPHKQAVFRVVDRHTTAARSSGAVNTLYWDGSALVADNTDVEGLSHVLQHDVGLQAGEDVVLFGAGGAARAAAVALGGVGARVEVVARERAAAQEVLDVAVAAGAAAGAGAVPRLVVNATPLGLHGERLPDRFMQLRPQQVALDLVYAPGDTPFLAAARAAGAAVLDGRGMLVAQAAAAFTRWTGVSAPMAVMAQAAHAALVQKD